MFDSFTKLQSQLVVVKEYADRTTPLTPGKCASKSGDKSVLNFLSLVSLMVEQEFCKLLVWVRFLHLAPIFC